MKDTKNEEFHFLILAALLHDIGKFWQRTGERLSVEDERIMPSCCPVYNNHYTHQHVLYSGRFIREIFEKRYGLVENLVLYHHMPESSPASYRRLVKILTLADWLSSGERRDKLGKEKSEPSKEPLISIFSLISLDGKSVTPAYVALNPLNLDFEPLFPKDNKDKIVSRDSYANIWNDFYEESTLLKNAMGNLLIKQFIYLLQKYTSTIPSATYTDKPDISLYHHLKSTAAIASCLYLSGIGEDEISDILEAIKSSDDKKLQNSVCLLLAGDISGIQDFIYSVTSEKALKGLKGRSFYLQLLAETIVKTVLMQFNLLDCNVIYCGGGNFYLLLPNTEGVIDELNNLKKLFNQNLLMTHRSRLALSITSVPASYNDFLDMNFANLWLRARTLLAIEKNRKFVNFFESKEKTEIILGPYDEGGEKTVCEVCGEEIDEGRRCNFCKSFEELAREICTAKYILETYKKPTKLEKPATTWNESLEAFGIKWTLLQETAQAENVYVVNSTNFLIPNRLFVGYKFFSQNTPRYESEIKTLEQISEIMKGVKKWGVLRGDVDDLGRVFSEGLGQGNKTISRVSMLSEMLAMFFSAHIEKIAREPNFKDSIYPIYAGGDDFFVLGTWSKLPDFAWRCYCDFRKFTAQNLTLSAAIYIAPAQKFPLYQAGNETKSDLQLAKTGEKNKFAFLGSVIPWQKFKEIVTIKDKIVELLDKEGPNIPRSLLQILHYGYLEMERFKRNNTSMVRIWRFLYALKRLKERHRKYADKLCDLENAVMTAERLELVPYLEVSIRWAELLTRKEV